MNDEYSITMNDKSSILFSTFVVQFGKHTNHIDSVNILLRSRNILL